MITKSLFQLGLGLSSIMLVACSGMSGDRSPAAIRAALEKQREHELQHVWRGQSYDALLNSYGAPQLIMNVPGYRPLKTSVVIYGVRDQTSRCIDAFTVVAHGQTKQWTVADYFCR